jgi:hypothetical protein
MRRQEQYLIDKSQGYASRQFMESALRKYQPGMFDQMSLTFQSHLSQNTAKIALEGIQTSTDYDIQTGEVGAIIPLEMWTKENEYFRESIKWHEELTSTDARILSERYDRDTEYQMRMGNTDPFSLHNIGAALGAAAFDPLSYIPFVGPAAKLASGAKAAYQVARIGKHTADIGSSITMQGALWGGTVATKRIAEVSMLSKFISPIGATLKAVASPFKPIATYSMEGMLAESAYQTIKHMSDARAEEDIDYMGGVFDVMIAGIFGGVLGTLPMAINFRRNFKKEQLHQALAKAVDDMGEKGYVAMDGVPPDADVRLSPEDTKKNYDKDMEGLEETVIQNDKDLHPIQSFFGGAWEDTKVGIRTAINAYRRCSS